MEQYELGIALVMARIAELRRRADRWRLASRLPGQTAGRCRNRVPGSPRRAGRPGQAADRAAGGRAAAATTTARVPGEQPRREPC